MRTSDTVIIEINNEPFRDAMVRAVMAEPLVTAVAASWPDMFGRPRAGRAEGSVSGRSPVAFKFVSPEYFSVLGSNVVKGRGFTPAERNAAVAIVSESVSRQLWPNSDAVGQVLRLEADASAESQSADNPRLPSRTLTVVGVIRDVAGFRLANFKEAAWSSP